LRRLETGPSWFWFLRLVHKFLAPSYCKPVPANPVIQRGSCPTAVSRPNACGGPRTPDLGLTSRRPEGTSPLLVGQRDDPRHRWPSIVASVEGLQTATPGMPGGPALGAHPPKPSGLVTIWYRSWLQHNPACDTGPLHHRKLRLRSATEADQRPDPHPWTSRVLA